MHKVRLLNKEDATMKKMMYIQPSVMVTEMVVVQTLCASGDSDSGSVTFSQFNPEATTDSQL